MKISAILLFCCLVNIFASPTYSQSTKISLNLKDATIEEVLNKIEDVSEFYFLFNHKLIDVTRKVNIEADKEPIKDILNDILNDGIKFIVYDRQIILTPSDLTIPSAAMQQLKITGTVTDSQTGEAMPGVNILVKGTTNGAMTDEKGTYTLMVPDASVTLQFSFIGYVTQEIELDGRTTLSVALTSDIAQLSEVVVVGFGTQKKVNLTGSISTLKFDERAGNRPITNVSQALGGEVTGLWVSQNSGKPGSDGAQLRVRGWGTLNNSNPLIIVDGVEGSFDQINPSDIESISVLKDAASAAIYGSKAANGVVLITTKMGKRNEKLQVSLTSYYGIQSLGRRYDVIDNSAESMELSNQALVNGGSSRYFPDDLITAFKNGNDPYKYPNTNWFDELFKTASIQEHNVSVMGGSTQSSSFLSLNYLNQEGMIPNTNSNRYGIRANLESNVNKWLKVSGRFNYIMKASEEPYADATYGSLGRVFDMLGGAAPFIAPYTRDGRFGSVQSINQAGSLLYDNRNPLIDAANGLTKTEENFLTVNASTEIKFLESFLLKTTLASTGNWRLTDIYNESIFGYTDTGIETITKNYNREGLEISRRNVSGITNNMFTTLNYSKRFAEIHDFSAIAGVQFESTIIKNQYSRRTKPPKEGLTQVDAGTSGIQGEGNMNGLKMLSYFGRINYSLSDKYLFEANLRADASSRFKEGNRWGIFPGFSAGWKLIDEKFIQNLNFFSNLKLRASWGQLGNQNIAGYWPYLTVISQDNTLSYSQGGTFAPGAAVTSLVDENITWETTSTLDFGIDIGLLKNKINIETDYFKKKTSDIIVQLPIPQVLGGVTAPYENVGEMLNNGFEIVINYDNQAKKREQFGYNISVNMTYIDNEVTKFLENSPDQLYLIREGYSYRALYGYNAVGIYQTDEEALLHMYSNSYKPTAGNLKFEDVNNDGKLGFEDKQVLGNTIPKFTFGLTSGFRYKGFDLNFLFQGIANVSVYTQNNFTNLNWETLVISKRWRDAWTPENTETDIPKIRFNNSWDLSESSFWVHETNFLKLKNIQLGYAFSDNILSHLGIQKIYVYANAQNVFSIVNKDYEGYDPERNTFDSGFNLYPTPRIISFGVNLNF